MKNSLIGQTVLAKRTEEYKMGWSCEVGGWQVARLDNIEPGVYYVTYEDDATEELEGHDVCLHLSTLKEMCNDN